MSRADFVIPATPQDKLEFTPESNTPAPPPRRTSNRKRKAVVFSPTAETVLDPPTERTPLANQRQAVAVVAIASDDEQQSLLETAPVPPPPSPTREHRSASGSTDDGSDDWSSLDGVDDETTPETLSDRLVVAVERAAVMLEQLNPIILRMKRRRERTLIDTYIAELWAELSDSARIESGLDRYEMRVLWRMARCFDATENKSAPPTARLKMAMTTRPTTGCAESMRTEAIDCVQCGSAMLHAQLILLALQKRRNVPDEAYSSPDAEAQLNLLEQLAHRVSLRCGSADL